MEETIPEDIAKAAGEALGGPDVRVARYVYDVTSLRVARAIMAERERCAAIADKQAWAHGGRHFDGPELNSSAIATSIRSGV